MLSVQSVWFSKCSISWKTMQILLLFELQYRPSGSWMIPVLIHEAGKCHYFHTWSLSVRSHFLKSRKIKQLPSEKTIATDCVYVRGDHCCLYLGPATIRSLTTGPWPARVLNAPSPRRSAKISSFNLCPPKSQLLRWPQKMKPLATILRSRMR